MAATHESQPLEGNLTVWPFRPKIEKRESIPFTDAVVAALAAQAGGQSVGDPSAIAALEAATALYSRAFSAARISPAIPALTPSAAWR